MPPISDLPDWNYPTPSKGDATGSNLPLPAEPTVPPAIAFDGPGYLAEVEARHTGQQPPAGSGLDPKLLDEWDRFGGREHHLMVASDAVNGMLDGMPAEERSGFEASFDALPAGAQTAVYSYLALHPGAARTATDAELQTFASIPEQAELVKEWGSRASRNLGVVRQRMSLMLDAMSASDREAAGIWFDNLPPAQAKAVLRGLAG